MHKTTTKIGWQRSSMTFSLRSITTGKWLKTLHKVLALTFGIVFIAQGLTGALLSINSMMVETSPPNTTHNDSLTFGEVYDAVGNIRPHKHITFIQYHPDKSVYDVVLKEAQNSEKLVINSYSGNPVNTDKGTFFDRQWLLDIHAGKLPVAWLKPLLGIAAVAMIIVTITGIMRALPSKRILSISTRNTPAFMFSTHRSIGMIASVLLLVTAGTGVIMMFNQAIRTHVFSLMDHSPYPKPGLINTQGQLPKYQAEDINALAHAAIADIQADLGKQKAHNSSATQAQIQVSFISFPSQINQPIQVRMRQDNSWHRIGRTQVYFHPLTLKPIERYNEQHANPSQRFFDNIYPIHGLHFGNLNLSGIHILTCLLILYFSVTGVYLTLRGISFRRRKTRSITSITATQNQ